jgi:hypothetical protein
VAWFRGGRRMQQIGAVVAKAADTSDQHGDGQVEWALMHEILIPPDRQGTLSAAWKI